MRRPCRGRPESTIWTTASDYKELRFLDFIQLMAADKEWHDSETGYKNVLRAPDGSKKKKAKILDFQDWWEGSANQHFISDKFLNKVKKDEFDQSPHEWIPRNMIGELIPKTAENIKKQKNIIQADKAADWYEFLNVQHRWRSPTWSIIFDPGKSRYVRKEVDPTDKKEKYILQGHVGAVYHNFNTKWKPGSPMDPHDQQKRGEPHFHEELRRAVRNGTKLNSLEKAQEEIIEVIKDNVWDGSQRGNVKPATVSTMHYSKARGANLGFDGLGIASNGTKTQEDLKDAMIKDVKKAAKDALKD